jgi:serine protease Do
MLRSKYGGKKMKQKNRFIRYMVGALVIAFITGVGLQMATASKEAPAQLIPGDFSNLAYKVRSGVVNIRTVSTVKQTNAGLYEFFNNPFGEFFNSPSRSYPDETFKQQGLGSGFIIDGEGYIVTNNHVIENANEIKVKLANEKEYDAEIVGRDPKTDLALIKIDGARGLTPLQLGDSNRLRVGTWVVAIGSPFGLDQTVTAGIVSAKGRAIGAGPYDDFIQTDASINPGNSGGPLMNMEGEVVGINTAIMSRSGGNNGIGFAIPINMARTIVEQLKEDGEVTRAWLGVVIQDLSPELAEYYKIDSEKGVLVTQVYEGDPAEKAGIRANDIITEVDGEKVSSSRELSRKIANLTVGDQVPVTIVRDGKEETISVKLARRVNSEAPVKLGGKPSGNLGLQIAELTPETSKQLGFPEDEKGVLVTRVQPGGKGALAGIRSGDVIKEVNRVPVDTPMDVKKQVEKVDSGDSVNMLIKRANAGLLVRKIIV